MRTTLTFIFATCFTFLFAQDIDTLPAVTASTDFIIGFNNTSVTVRNTDIIDAYGDNGFQVGVMRKYPIGKRSTFSFGANMMTVKHQLTFKGQTVAFNEEGLRAYNNLYFRVPVEWAYSIKANSPYFVSGGLNLSSAIQNRSTEVLLRTVYMDDFGKKFENPYQKNLSGYREVASLDLGVRVGGGAKFRFSKVDFTAAVYYNQGLLTKDMNFRQRQVEFQLGMTLPSIRRVQKSTSQAPGYWMN